MQVWCYIGKKGVGINVCPKGKSSCNDVQAAELAKPNKNPLILFLEQRASKMFRSNYMNNFIFSATFYTFLIFSTSSAVNSKSNRSRLAA